MIDTALTDDLVSTLITGAIAALVGLVAYIFKREIADLRREIARLEEDIVILRKVQAKLK